MPALLLLLLLPCLSFAQPDTTWSRSFRLDERSFLYDAIVYSDTVVVACGYSQTGTGIEASLDFLICAYTTSGDSLYALNILETEENEAFESLALIGGDTVVAIGWSVQDGRALNVVAFHALTGEYIWDHVYAPTGRTKGRGICALDGGGFAAVGYRGGPSNRSDLWFLVCDANGDTLLTRVANSNATDIGNDVMQLPDGNVRVAALWRDDANADWDQWTRLYDTDGNIVTTDQFFGTNDNDFVYNLALDPLENVWLIGNTTGSGGAGYVSIRPASGVPQSLTFATPGWADQFHGGIPWFGGMMFAGRSGNVGLNTSFFMKAIDENYGVLWSWRFGTLGTDGGFNNLIQLPSGGALALGTKIDESDTAVVSAYLMAISPPAGVQGLVTSLTDNEPIMGAHVQAVGDARFTITNPEGVYRLELAAGFHDIVVSGACIETDTLFGIVVEENELTQGDFQVGEPAFQHLQSSVNIIAPNQLQGHAPLQIGNDGTGLMFFSVEVEALLPAGDWLSVAPATGVLEPGQSTEVIITAEADTTNDGTYEFFGQVTIRSNACPDTMIVLPILIDVLDADDSPTLATEFSLSPAYPNPFNSSTTVTLSLPAETDVTVEVYNVLGRWTQTLLEGRQVAGNHVINIDLSSQPAGLYFVRAVSPTANAVQKLLYVR